MKTQDFTNLYSKKDTDETISSFQNEIGFSLIRPYPKDTPYYKDGRRIFIKIAILERGLFYGVDMTKPEKRGQEMSYIITDGKEYEKKVTNFFSDNNSNEFIFNSESKKIKHIKSKKEFTLNEFIDILVKNHLSDRLFWKRSANALVNIILKIFFWLTDKYYEAVKVSIDKYHFSRDNKPIIGDGKKVEPFFKYFYISKNLIFTILLLFFIVVIFINIFPYGTALKYILYPIFGEFSLSNPVLVLFFFLILFSSEKFSIWLNKKIKEFLMPDESIFSKVEDTENFIEKLHNYQYHNNFNLRL